jgi:hypothetical protein
MAQELALVDDVRDIGVETQRGRRKEAKVKGAAIRVRFAKGADGRLNPESPRDRTWAEVLEWLRTSHQPAYVEIDPETRYITSLLIPRSFLVMAVREVPGSQDLELDLEISQMRHYLRRDHPRFNETRKILENAWRTKTPVLVTENLDSSAIVDVRPAAVARRRN